jgi:hypothetical protein
MVVVVILVYQTVDLIKEDSNGSILAWFIKDIVVFLFFFLFFLSFSENEYEISFL